MKQSFVSAAMAALTSAYSYRDLPLVNVDQFDMRHFSNQVDHFNFLDDRTYEQRYWVSDEYTSADGPIFIYICGEYRCSVPDTRLYPFMIGAKHNAQFVVVEHRFYGESQPFDTWELDNLAYLNSEQALADLAYFIGNFNTDNRDVFVIGGSYPGALSAWFRERYPHLAVGAWSSSGVVQPIVDFWKFDEQTYQSTVKSGKDCPEIIQESMAYVTDQGQLRDAGAKSIIDETLSGDSVGMRTDDWMFYYADIFLESVQYGHRSELCDILTSLDRSDKDSIVMAAADFGTNVAGVNPPDYDTRMIASTEIDTHSSARPWTFQYCTEYGWFQVPSEEHVMRSDFYLSMPYWPEMCSRSFGGLDMTNRPKAKSTTIDQGGVDIAVENIFFANGTEDPWKWATRMTSNEALNQVAHTSECDNCGHCVELYTPSDDDSVELQETRRMILEWVDDLLSKNKTEKMTTFLQ